MSFNGISNSSIDVLKREQARFADIHATLQEELFEASEAFKLLPSKRTSIVRKNSVIEFRNSQVTCDDTEGIGYFRHSFLLHT